MDQSLLWLTALTVAVLTAYEAYRFGRSRGRIDAAQEALDAAMKEADARAAWVEKLKRGDRA